MIRLILVLLAATVSAVAQQRPVPELVVDKSYSYKTIPGPLRAFVMQNDRSAYFNDVFFNSTLRQVLEDKEFSPREKVQLFYLLLQKIGYGFAGVSYIPPTLNYYRHHLGIVYVFEKMRKSLEGTRLPVSGIMEVVRAELGTDDLLATNALLLATLLEPDSALPCINKFTNTGAVENSEIPAIFNHNLCMAASIVQNDTTVANLTRLVFDLKHEAMKEDALCALYAKPNPLATIQRYILAENDHGNDLAIQTALNALEFKLGEEAFRRTAKSLAKKVRAKWKQDLITATGSGKIPFGYHLSSAETLVTKVWNGYTVSHYLNGNLISAGDFMEFDPN